MKINKKGAIESLCETLWSLFLCGKKVKKKNHILKINRKGAIESLCETLWTLRLCGKK